MQNQAGRPQAQPGRHQDQYDQRAAAEAAQTCLLVLNRAIPEEPRPFQSATMAVLTVDHEMHSAFPGTFLKGIAKNKGPPCHVTEKTSKKSRKPLQVNFLLLASKHDTTPSSHDELELMQAGLGKRTLAITNDFSHLELSSLLRTAFPKMNNLQDRWLLYKASGEREKGKMPKYSTNDANNDLFKTAGEIFAVSLAQGGPAPRFLQEWCYNYLVTGVVDKTHVLHYPLIKEIEDASDPSPLAERLADCGYTGKVDVDRKENIIRAIVLHIIIHCTAMLQQLREGLEVYDLIQVMQRKPVECRGLFVDGEAD